MTALAGNIDADLLKAVRATCVTCWKASHPAPPATALYLMDDYKWELSHEMRLEGDVYRMARAAGWEGPVNDLQYAAHREAFAAGDDDQLEAMLRHVRPVT